MNLPDRQQKASNPLHGTYPVCYQFPWRGTRQNKNRRPMTQLIGSAHLSAGGSILVSDVGGFFNAASSSPRTTYMFSFTSVFLGVKTSSMSLRKRLWNIAQF